MSATRTRDRAIFRSAETFVTCKLPIVCSSSLTFIDWNQTETEKKKGGERESDYFPFGFGGCDNRRKKRNGEIERAGIRLLLGLPAFQGALPATRSRERLNPAGNRQPERGSTHDWVPWTVVSSPRPPRENSDSLLNSLFKTRGEANTKTKTKNETTTFVKQQVVQQSTMPNSLRNSSAKSIT